MSLTFEIQDGIGVFSRTGKSEFAEGVEFLRNGLLRLRQASDKPVILFDLTRSSDSSRGAEEMRHIGKVFENHAPRARLALLVSNSLSYGLSRMFQAYIDGAVAESAVFYDYDEAWAWCNSRLSAAE